MSPAEAAAFLRRYNGWRRTDDRYGMPYPDPREIGEAIDAAVEMIDRLEAAESEAIEQARLNGMGSEREAALMAKLEAAEKTNREWLRANAPGGWIDNLRIENEALRAEVIHIKEVEFPRKAQAVAEGWRGKCERLEAKVEQMERQEPVAWTTKLALRHGANALGFDACAGNLWGEKGVPLYALPGAQGEEK